MATLTVGHDKTYSTISAAAAAMDDGDTVEIYRKNESIFSYGENPAITKYGTFIGMEDGVSLHGFVDINESAPDNVTGLLVFENLAFYYDGTVYMPKSNDAIVRFIRCFIYGYGFNTSYGHKIQILNCACFECSFYYGGGDFRLLFANSVAIRLAGSYIFNREYNCTIVNSVLIGSENDSIFPDTSDVNNHAKYSYIDYNIGNATTASLGPNGQTKTAREAGLIVFQDGASIAQNIDYRIEQSDEIAGTTSLGGYDLTTYYTTDIDGRTRTQYSIGCSEGYQVYGPPEQADAPTIASITDSGNGVTWTATASGQAAGAALQWALLSDSSTIVATTDGSGETAELTAGQVLQVRALEAGKTASDWYTNGGAGIEVPELEPYDLPDNGEVAAGVSFNYGANVGTRVDAPTADTLEGTVYGDPASPLNGRYREPVNDTVLDTTSGGSLYGVDAGTEGALAMDLPDLENVLTTDTSGGAAGLYVHPEPEIVADGESYGYGHEGTFVAAGTYPAPTLTMTPGSLTLTRRLDDDSALFYYRPGTGFYGGCLIATHEDGGIIQVNLAGAGPVQVDGLEAGRYTVYASSWNVDRSQVVVTAPFTYIHYAPNTEDSFEIDWRCDYNDDWTGGEYPLSATRERIVTNVTAHWLQWRIRCKEQNHRLTLRSAQVETRFQGMAQNAEQQ